MKVCDIVNYMGKWAPYDTAESFDNVGLLIGNSDSDVSGILICLDVTDEIITEAIEKNCNLIISHHPFIFTGVKCINDKSPIGRRIMSVIQNDIAVLSCHTNLDIAIGGVNDTLANKIGVISNINDGYITLSDSGCRLGIKGQIKAPTPLSNYVSIVKSALNCPDVKVVGNMQKTIKNVAVFCGAFDSELIPLLKDVDLIVTGDLKHHVALELAENGITAIDAYHYYTENVILEEIYNRLNKNFNNSNIYVTEKGYCPFQTI